jgi:YHS domain-containing protein
MSGLMSLLVFAAFFYLIMRFGCGSHMVHGSHRGHGGREGHGHHGTAAGGVKPGLTARDPVCSMEVDPAQGGYTETYQGRQYHFCSRRCLDRFDDEPQRCAYTPAATGTPVATAHRTAGLG